MKVCINLRDQDFANTKSMGIYNVALGLTRALAEKRHITKLIILANSSLQEALSELLPNQKVEVIGANQAPPRGLSRFWWDQWGIVQAVNKLHVDWLILPKGFPPFIRWPNAESRVCSYIHDNIFQFYADMGWPGIPTFEKHYFSRCYRRAIKKADLVVTNSQFTLDEVMAAGRTMPASKVGIGFEQPELRQEGVRKGILIFTSSHPHKLTGQSILWLERWKEENHNPVVIYGVGSMPDDVEWPERDDWIKMPRVSDQEMQELWQKVEVLVYFSAYEGFGMPPCEAIKNGVIPLASDIPPHRETLAKECLFSNDDYETFAARLNGALKELRLPACELDSWPVVGDRLVNALERASAKPENQ